MRTLALRRRAEERRTRESTVLKRAILLSLVLHFVGAGFIAGRARPIVRPPKRDVIVVTSNALTIGKRTVPQASAAHRATRVAPPAHAPRAVALVPPAPSAARHPRPAAAPPRVVAPKLDAPPTAVPRRVAAAPEHETPIVPPRLDTPAHERTSAGSISALERSFEKTIREARSRNNPLRVAVKPASAPTRMPIPVIGIHEGLHGGQGVYRPIDRGWRRDGWDYYYVTYEFEWEDGTYERGAVPWPIRFRPESDPFLNNVGTYVHVPLAGPLPDWELPPGTRVGRALRGFFPPDTAFAN